MISPAHRQRGAVALLAAVLTSAPAAASPDPLAECEARVRAAPEGWESSCFYRAAREGRWAEAGRRLARLLGGAPDNPWLGFNLGRIELEHGSDERAEALFRAAAAGFAARGERAGEVYSRLNLATCRERRGDLAGALPELDRAAAAARPLGDRALLAQVRVYQARALAIAGRDVGRAERLLREVEADAVPDGPFGLQTDFLLTLGNVEHGLGRPDRALAAYERLADLAGRAGDGYVEAGARYQIAMAETALLPTPAVRGEARRRAREAVDSAASAGRRDAEARARLLAAKLERGPERAEDLARSVALARAAGEASTLAAALHAQAADRAAADPARAARLLDEALAVALAADDPWSVLYGWGDRLRVRWATLPREAAIADGMALVAAVESLRELQPTGGERAALFSAWTEVHAWLAGRLLAGEPPGAGPADSSPGSPPRASPPAARADLERAFAIAERMRARVLLDALEAAGARTPPPAAAPLLARRRTALAQVVAAQRRLLDPRLAGEDRSRTAAALARLERSAADLDAKIAGLEHPAASAEPGFAALPEVEAALRDDEALLSFQVGLWQDVYGDFAGGSWLLAVTRRGTRAYSLPDRVRLEPAVPVYAGLLEARGDAEGAPAARLYAELLGPALAELPPGIQRLVLVPDGALHRLPFASLRAHAGGPPLAARYRLTQVPSATLWLRWRRHPPPPPASAALVFADPAFAGAAESPRETPERGGAFAAAGRLGRLPFARREGRALLARLSRVGEAPSRLAEDGEASERLVKTVPLGRFGVLHFAAHALLDEERPERSAVLLAPGGPGEDGLLQPREIAALDLGGRAVVLAACRSASGELLQGEGVMSLARAFFAGGAHAVVGSLWPLRDDEAAALFDRLYLHLAEGATLSEALARAQLDRHREGAPAAAWAGVVLLGDGDLALPAARRRPGPLVWIFAAAALAAGGLLAWRRSRRPNGP